MAEKDSRRVKTLSEFIEWAAQFNDGKYLFRGVPNDDFKIEAAAYRRLPKLSGNLSKLLEINKRLIEDARSLGHDQKNGQQLSDLELLAELQHFGAATCLIDFSRSALVALWFACQQRTTEQETNGKVFAVRRDDPARFKTVNPELIKQNIDYFFNPDEDNKYWLYQWEPKLQNSRIIAQHSVFVFGRVEIESVPECIIIKSSKLKIKSNKQKILESLNQLSDITEASIFPDFDGFARLHAHDKPYVESNAHTYLRRGNEALQNNNLDDAISYYTEVIRLAPAHPGIVAEAHNNRGIIYNKKGEIDRAIKDYSKSIELKPDFDHVYFNRGNAYHSKKDYDPAIADFTRAVEINPDLAEAYTNRGLVYADKKDYDLAIADHSKAIELKPNYPEAYFNRGGAYKSKGDDYNNKGEYDLAIADFTQAIEINPNFVGAYNHRGVAYLVKDDYDPAIEDFAQAIKLKPGDAEVYYNRGLAHFKKSDYASANGDFTRAIDLKPHFVVAVYYNRGRVWLHQEEWEKAESDLKMARTGMDIITAFLKDYGSVLDFKTKHSVQLPPDIAAMLTPSQA